MNNLDNCRAYCYCTAAVTNIYKLLNRNCISARSIVGKVINHCVVHRDGQIQFAVAALSWIDLHTHTHPFNGPLSGTTRVSQYQKGKTNLDFSEARDSEWQWHRLDHMQVCTSLQTDYHADTSLLVD